MTFSNAALQRRRARKAQREKAYQYALVQHYDATKTGSLNKEEVTTMAQQMLTAYDAEASSFARSGLAGGLAPRRPCLEGGEGT